MIEKRGVYKTSANYMGADKIRKELEEKGIILNDSKKGTTWDVDF